ncbi:MAG: efflux RND transporter periplasmic adaptor subunit [Desulfobacterales bacterium]|nr:efflux RND transporter periplasmic adaptor subunit [Desulfobacterales bacterium]
MKIAIKMTAVTAALVLLGVVMAYLAGYFEEKIPIDFRRVLPDAGDGESLVVKVNTEPLVERAAGTLRAKVETVISPLITATISSIAVWAGDEVEPGEVLVSLDARELKARLDQARQSVVSARAQLTRTEKEAQRVRRIFKSDPGAISKAERDRIEAALSTARARSISAQRYEDEARTALSYSKLTSPIAGRIVERYADPGDTARPGVPVLRLYNPATLRLEASVRESVASKLTENQAIVAEIDAVGKRFDGVVDEIVPSADPGSRTFLVKVNLSTGSRLYPGMFGRLLIPIGQTERIYIPAAAVTEVGQLNFVIIRTEQGNSRRYVRLGQRGPDDQIEVVSGLKAGEQILISRQ